MNGHRYNFLLALVVVVMFSIVAILPGAMPAYSDITGVDPPGSGDWNIDEDTVVEDENIILEGNATLQTGASLSINNSVIVFEKSIHMEEDTTLRVTNSTVVIGGYLDADVDTEIYVSHTDITFKKFSGDHNGGIYSQGDRVTFYDVCVNSEDGRHFVIDLYGVSDARFVKTNVTNAGIPYILDGVQETFETAVYFQRGSLYVEDSIFKNTTGTAIQVIEGEAEIVRTSIFNSTYGLATAASNTILEECSIASTKYGIYFWESNISMEDNFLGGNEIGVVAIGDGEVDLDLFRDIWDNNDFSSPSNNDMYNIAYKRLIRARVLGAREQVLASAVIDIEETGWRGITGFEPIFLNGTSPLRAYARTLDGKEEYPRYTIHTSFNTGLYNSTTTLVLDISNITLPANRILDILTDAGPDLVLNHISLSTSAAVSGSTIYVTMNITNYWWYDVENVTVSVDTDRSRNEMVVESIPANGTIETTLSLNVGDVNEVTTLVVTGYVDPDRQNEGHHIDRGNNRRSTTLEVRPAIPDSSVPVHGLLAAIIILLIIFIISMHRALWPSPDSKYMKEEGGSQEVTEEMGQEKESAEKKETQEAEPEASLNDTLEREEIPAEAKKEE